MLCVLAVTLAACGGEKPMTAVMEKPPAGLTASPSDPLPGPGQTTVTHPIP